MHKNKRLYIKIHRNMHKNQKNHLLSKIKPCILNQSENKIGIMITFYERS